MPEKKFINRGFLHGPYCPIYGTGAFVILVLVFPFSRYPAVAFAASLICATILEYFTSWLMEAIFQIRWWDYSNYKYNLNGRICLKNSLLFGIMGLAMIYLVHPAAVRFVGFIPGKIQRLASSVIISAFILDLVYTLNVLLKLTDRLRTARFYFSELEKFNNQYSWFQANDLTGSILRLREISAAGGMDEKLAGILDSFETIIQKRGEMRLINAFPKLRQKEFGVTLDRLREVWERKIETRKDSLKGRGWNIARHFSRLTAAEAKDTNSSFTAGLNLYNVVWVFMIASVLGYVVETLFCLVTRGVLESRQGLIYGPLSQIYGFGAVLLALLLTPLTKKNDRWLFMGSAILGGAFEFLCSYIQESVFGSVSWEYGDQAFSIGGRTSLTYMFFWGILGVVFMKGIYPALSRLIERIPRRQGLFFSWVFIVTISVNMFLSGTAVYRWSQRLRNVPPANAYELFLDTQYPDDMLKEIYPNMTMLRTPE